MANVVTLNGYMVANPVTSSTSGAVLCRIRVRNESGEKMTIGFAAYGAVGRHILTNCYKGKQLFVKGELRSWVDKDGNHRLSVKALWIEMGPDASWAERPGRSNEEEGPEDDGTDYDNEVDIEVVDE